MLVECSLSHDMTDKQTEPLVVGGGRRRSFTTLSYGLEEEVIVKQWTQPLVPKLPTPNPNQVSISSKSKSNLEW